MQLYDELSRSITETLSSANESVDLKARLSKLIENYFENSYTDSDIDSVIKLVRFAEEAGHGD